MLEYHGHIAVLRGLRATMGAAFAGEPTLSAKIADLLASVDADPDAAILGACIDEIVAHGSSDGTELDLLASAADLWSRGRGLYDDLTLARQEIEAALLKPTASDSIALVQSGVSRLDGLRTGAKQLAAEAQSLKAAIAPLPHLDAHPRQSDTPSKQWTWRDAFLGRRTDAFVRHLFEQSPTPRTRAFAFGVLSSYAGNTAGSAYLGCVVGGPRRAHRYRDRLARNAVGAWLHDTFKTPRAAEISQQLRFLGLSGRIAFPEELAKSAQHAFAKAYPNRPAPDLDLGLRRAVRHLRLLDRFERPRPPEPPPLVLAKSGEVAGTLTILSDNDPNIPTVGIGLDPDMTPGQPTRADSQKSSGNACLAILLIVITLGVALLIYCIGKWTTGKECSPKEFLNDLQGSDEPDPRAPTGINQQQLEAMTQPDAAAHIAQELFNIQMLLWQGFDAALAYLAVTGLVYPDDLLMTSPLYQQFVLTPARTLWPHREEANALNQYHKDPASPIEQPPAADPPFPPNQTPAAFVIHWSSDQLHTAGKIAGSLVRQILRGEMDSENYDLDADRGFRHPCWSVAAGTSIDDSPLSVEILSFKAE